MYLLLLGEIESGLRREFGKCGSNHIMLAYPWDKVWRLRITHLIGARPVRRWLLEQSLVDRVAEDRSRQAKKTFPKSRTPVVMWQTFKESRFRARFKNELLQGFIK